MKIREHYLVTLIALISIGVLIKNPGMNKPTQDQERVCKMNKGRMDCLYRYTDYRINKNSEIQYKLN